MGIVRLGAGLDCLPEAYTLCDARTCTPTPRLRADLGKRFWQTEKNSAPLFSLMN